MFLRKLLILLAVKLAGLSLKDPGSKIGNINYQFGADPHYVKTYIETYSKLSPLAILPSRGQVVSVPDLMPYDEFRRGRLFQEWAQPQGWIDAAYVALENSRLNSTVLIIFPSKTRGMVDDDMRRRIALIAPHASRALLIGKSFELKQSEAATFADTLNGLSAGMFLLDAHGQIVHANAAGQNMLYASDFLRSANGRLATRDPLVDQTLCDALAAAKGDARADAKAVALPLTAHDGERYVAQVLPLGSGARLSTALTYQAVAAVFVRKAALENPPHSDLIAKTYKLTPAELRVLDAIVEIGGVPETAAALGIAETTVKTHLYRLFDKTDASRQADLVKLVAGFSNPLIDG